MTLLELAMNGWARHDVRTMMRARRLRIASE
jgi:hypothetical protein